MSLSTDIIVLNALTVPASTVKNIVKDNISSFHSYPVDLKIDYIESSGKFKVRFKGLYSINVFVRWESNIIGNSKKLVMKVNDSDYLTSDPGTSGINNLLVDKREFEVDDLISFYCSHTALLVTREIEYTKIVISLEKDLSA